MADSGASRQVRYPNHYTWLVFVASLDIFFTYLVLWHGGFEANPLASNVLARWGMPGMVVFKLALVTLAIVIAEEVGRRDERKGRKFAEYAIGICAFPVIFALALFSTRL